MNNPKLNNELISFFDISCKGLIKDTPSNRLSTTSVKSPKEAPKSQNYLVQNIEHYM